MPITIQHTQEQLSRAFVTAVAGRAGVNIGNLREHDYGIDGTFHRVMLVDNKRIDDGYPVDFQLKSVTTWVMREEEVCYDCPVETYNPLATRSAQQGGRPCLLLVLCLPTGHSQWLQLSEEAMILRRCCYWYQVTGAASANRETERIHIPRAQTFTPEALLNLLERFSEVRQL